jgi:hypothetical protein
MAAYEFLYQEDIYQITNTIVVLIDKPWREFRDEDKALLTKILGSVKIPIDQVQLINSTKTDLRSLSVYDPVKIVSFGVPLEDVSELYKCHTIGKTSLILSDGLTSLDDARKKSLWAALKQMFT